MGKILGLPVYHLDRLYWKAGWISTPKEEWMEIQQRLCSEPEWIIDGNYGATMDIRFAACDTVIFLDFPRWLCILRVLKRFFVYRGVSRGDLTEGCKERITKEFLLWVWNYRQDQRPGILDKLAKLQNERSIYILRSRKDTHDFLNNLLIDGKLRRDWLRG